MVHTPSPRSQADGPPTGGPAAPPPFLTAIHPPRAASDRHTERALSGVLGLCVVSALAVVVAQPFGSLRSAPPGQSAPEVAGVTVRPIRGAVPVGPPPTLAPASTPTAAPTPPPPATTGGVPSERTRMQVAGTGGTGVVLHRAPSPDTRVPAGFVEGTQVTVLEQHGGWAHVRGDTGLDGWVLAQYLAPVP